MKTLIIPCAGNEKIYGIPLILNHHPKDGMILAEKLLSGIFPETYDRIIFTVTQETDNSFNVSETVRSVIPRAEVIALPEKTSGPADTVYKTILHANINGEIAIKDSSNMIILDSPAQGNMIAGLDLMHYDNAIENLRRKSFITLNEQDDVLDIAEKRLRSDIISVGLYCFRNAEDFTSAFERLSDQDYGITSLYASHIISYLIGHRNFVFHCRKVSFFEDWSSSWQKLRSNFNPIIESKNIRVIMTDLDGTLIDTVRVNYLAYKEALEPFGGKIDYDYFKKFCNGRHYKAFVSEILGRNDENILLEVHRHKKDLYRKYIHHAKINLPLMRILNMCRSECRLALVTTASSQNTSDILNAFGLENYFDLVITQKDTINQKPDPEGYIRAMKFFDASPEECIIFEDSETGIEAARRSGIAYFTVNIQE